MTAPTPPPGHYYVQVARGFHSAPIRVEGKLLDAAGPPVRVVEGENPLLILRWAAR